MNYDTWKALNDASLLAILVAPILIAIITFIARRRSHSPDGKRNGRPIIWSLAAYLCSLIALMIVWGVSLQEQFPDYVARREAETEAANTSGGEFSDGEVLQSAIGQWRPNNANRTDHFIFTADTYSSVNPDLNTTITFNYRVVGRESMCMRIQTTGSRVIQGEAVTEESSRSGEAFIVCVDPDTDQMLMSFDSEGGDVVLSRMN